MKQKERKRRSQERYERRKEAAAEQLSYLSLAPCGLTAPARRAALIRATLADAPGVNRIECSYVLPFFKCWNPPIHNITLKCYTRKEGE